MSKSSIYKRVKGRHGGSLQISELYKGPDHFLYLRSVLRLTEQYRRIPFRKITGLQIIKTSSRARMNVVGLICLLILSALWYAIGTSVASTVFWSILLGLTVLLMLVNTLAGPCCSVFLFTQHRRHLLQNFQRLKHAKRFQEELMEMLELQVDGPAYDPENPVASTPMEAPRQPPPRIAGATAFLKWASIMFIIAAAVDLMWLLWLQPGLLYLKAAVMSAGVVAVIWGAIRQRALGENPPASLWFISGIVFYLLKAGIIYILSLPIYFRSSVESETTWQLLLRIVNEAQELPLPFYSLMIATLFIQLAFGVLGLVAYRSGREQI